MSVSTSSINHPRTGDAAKPWAGAIGDDSQNVVDFFNVEDILPSPLLVTKKPKQPENRYQPTLDASNVFAQKADANKTQQTNAQRLSLSDTVVTPKTLPLQNTPLVPKPTVLETKNPISPRATKTYTPKPTETKLAGAPIDFAFAQWAKRLTPAWWPALGALEYTALAFLLLGISVLMMGAYRNIQTPSTTAKATPNLVSESPAVTLAGLMPIPTAHASVSLKRDAMTAVFPHPWQKFIDRLEAKHYSIVYSQQLHPRLYLIQLAKGVEINLLLSQNEKEVEEVSIRLHMLEANEPVQTYRQIMADMQDVLLDGALQQDAAYFEKLNLPLNLYSVPLPYAATYTSPQINAELQILDPIYLNLRFVPNHPSLPAGASATKTAAINP